MREYNRQKLARISYEREIHLQDGDDLLATLELQKRLIHNELSAFVVHTRKLGECALDRGGRA